MPVPQFEVADGATDYGAKCLFLSGRSVAAAGTTAWQVAGRVDTGFAACAVDQQEMRGFAKMIGHLQDFAVGIEDGKADLHDWVECFYWFMLAIIVAYAINKPVFRYR